MLSSYENIRRAIEFQRPDRLPMVSPIPERNDIFGFGWKQIGAGDPSQARSVDEWGCGWVRISDIDMGAIQHHPLANWGALADYRWPDADDPALYDGQEAKLAGSEEKYVRTGIFMLLFERMQALRGVENLLLEFYVEPEKVERLADRIVEFDLGIIENMARRFAGRIHGFMGSDDWGSQSGLFISPHLWREFFKPRYKRIFDAVHAAGWHMWLHSCGKVNAIMEDLIALGLDVANVQQPRLMGIETIGELCRGRLCFLSECDIQTTLPSGSPDDIRDEARLLLEHWSTPDGGFIFKDYTGGARALNASEESAAVMLEAFMTHDRWRPAAMRQ
jgi:uroporphyrinogen decarboxylase